MEMTFGGLAERENVMIKTTRNERVIEIGLGSLLEFRLGWGTS
jgi:hypothetical protein